MNIAERHPENHTEAVWLWPWPKEETREFFEDIQAVQAFAPGPDDTAIIKFILLSGYEMDNDRARKMFQSLAVDVCRMPGLPPETLERIVAKPLQPDGRHKSYIEFPVAQIPRSIAKDFGADFARLETLLPQAEREPGRGYAIEDTPDGYALRPDRDNEFLE